VIRTGGQVAQDAGIHPRVLGGPGDDFLEQVHADAPGAGIGEQIAPRIEQAETQEIDVLVGPGGPGRMGGGRGELGRVQDNQVETSPFLAQLAQGLEHIRLPPFRPLGGQGRIQGHIALGRGQGRAGGINGQHGGGPTGQGLETEAPGIAETVEHGLVRRQGPGEAPVFPLVQVEARLMAAHHIHQQAHSVFLDADVPRRGFPMEPPGHWL